MSRPLVSVIIPAFNAERFLADALASLAQQTLTDWEAVIVDDGSTDGTAQVAQSWVDRDPRIHMIRQANGGVSLARNVAMQASSGEFLAFLDADDFWAPSKLQQQVDTIQREGVDVVYCTVANVDAGAQKIARQPWANASSWGHLTPERFFVLQYTSLFLLPSVVLLRSEVIRQQGGFNPELRVAEDGELWLRLAQAGCTFFGMPDQLCFYRYHTMGLTHQGELNFWSSLMAFQPYADSPLLGPDERRKPFRVQFRNAFSYLDPRSHRGLAKRMFAAYRPYDADGYACRLMALLDCLPEPVFWLVCRYLVIPLAWHCERLGERWGRPALMSPWLPGLRARGEE